MNCKKCNNLLQDEAKFCGGCGAASSENERSASYRFWHNFILSVPDPNKPTSKLTHAVNSVTSFKLQALALLFFIAGLVLIFSGQFLAGLACFLGVYGFFWITKKNQARHNKQK